MWKRRTSAQEPTVAANSAVLQQPDVFLPLALQPQDARIQFDTLSFADDYNVHPIGLTHNLSTLELFQPEALIDLAKRYNGHPMDSFVAGSAPKANVDFNSVAHGQYAPDVAMTHLDEMPLRILLKRPEDHHPGFKLLMETLLQSISDARGGFGDEKIVRLQSSVFITSAKATTPIHFDPEVAFFTQIEGEKIYHVYPPDNVSEAELEPFYIKSSVEIGRVDASLRDPAKEHVFHLEPGKGLHQPQNAPHWVETCASRSVSYSVVFETNVTKSLGRTRAFNHYSRKAGIAPTMPGLNPAADAIKANAIDAVIPLRKMAGTILRKIKKH
jgi:hypothetical protein